VTWTRITCADRDQLMASRDLVPVSSCTDLDAEFHSEPEMFIEWGDRSTEKSVLRDYRYPARRPHPDDPATPCPDRKPCEHYQHQEDN